jgi:outer membrane protein assembly factor BamD
MRNLVVVVGLIAAACGGGGPPTVTPQPLDRLTEVRRLARQGKWAKALPLLQRLAFDLPPGQAEVAEVSYLTGEALFQTGSFVEAASQFHQVADEFPETPYAPLALLRAGDSNMRQWRKPQLDPTPGEQALGVYQELVGRYPDSEAATRGGIHVRRLRTWFAHKAVMNGVFYLRRKAYDSAILYFKDVVANFSDTEWAPRAVSRLIEAYTAIGYGEERKETCDHLRRFYPKAPVPESCPPATAADAAPPPPLSPPSTPSPPSPPSF